MFQTLEAVVDEQGRVALLQPVRLDAPRRALVVILDEEPTGPVAETALLSEAALAEDWNRPEEDAAWSHLQPAVRLDAGGFLTGGKTRGAAGR